MNLYEIQQGGVALATTDIEVDAQKRCSIILNKNGCQLSTCREQCFKSYNGFGSCTPISFGSYICSCFYNCPPL
ncbi:hypothetical protein CDL12_07172 [Handroanthus impetiginosus]|uniref:Knottin scorpion toxin-like domain-containing protein n=1 Tax=Handroanthus impetiginosus TaxID=429701 RepID=A0A2G9HRK2_9LAMI|nr:hypothetical protein CDL12_07172 [Handroanthus impetiginosus]